MERNPLLDMLSRLEGKMRLLRRQRDEAVARASGLEREVSEMISLVGQARARLEEMLAGGAGKPGALPGERPAPELIRTGSGPAGVPGRASPAPSGSASSPGRAGPAASGPAGSHGRAGPAPSGSASSPGRASRVRRTGLV